MEQSMLG